MDTIAEEDFDSAPDSYPFTSTSTTCSGPSLESEQKNARRPRLGLFLANPVSEFITLSSGEVDSDDPVRIANGAILCTRVGRHEDDERSFNIFVAEK